jgi:hypothetical protein
MASFTDNPQALSTFNPYVAQLPVDAMVKVGMQKQKQYDEGIQKIQTNIDNVAGLDVGRDVDKAYLQSKLNQLGSDLKWVGASDFSDFQLVNSVNGMTNQLAKDEYIQAAVSSTAIDRNQMSLIEDARSKGKLTPHAEFNYQLQRNAYYGNTELKQENGKPISFSGKYNPSWDIDKHMLEAIKAVGDSTWTADNVFKLDGNGNPMYYKDGSPVYSDFAIREKRAGKFNENISAAINTVLSRPEAKQELGMQGVYNYRGYDNIDDFVSQYKAEKEKGIAIGESQKIDLMSKINTEKDPAIKKQYQAQLNKLESDILELTTTEDARIVEAQGYGNNLDNYKAALQTQRKRNDYMKMGVTETYSKEYIKSIPYEVAQEKIKAERDWFIANDASARGWANIDISTKNYELNKDKWDYVKKNTPGAPGNELPIEGPVEPFGIYAKTLQEATDAENVMTSTKNDFVFKYIKALNFGNGKDLTDDQVRKSIASYTKKDPNFVSRMYDKGKQDVTDHPQNQYFTNLVTALPRLDQVEDDVIYYNGKLNDPDVINAGGMDVNFSAIEKNLKTTYEGEFSVDDGRANWFGPPVQKMTITPRDLMNFSIYSSTSLQPNSSSAVGKMYTKAVEELQRKYGSDMSQVSQEFSKNIRKNPNLLNDFNIVRNTIKSQKFTNALAAKEAVLKEKSKGNSPLVYTIYPKDAKGTQITSVNDRVDAVLSTFKEGDINVSEFTNLKKANAGYTTFIKVDRDNGNKILLALYDGNSLVKELQITKPQMDKIKGFTVELPPVVSRTQRRMTSSGERGTTNSAGADVNSPTAYKTALFKPDYFFKKFNRQDVLGADVKKNEVGEPNVYFYIKDSEGNVSGIPYKLYQGDINPHAFDNVDAAEAWVRNTVLRSGDIDNVINNSKPKK